MKREVGVILAENSLDRSVGELLVELGMLVVV